MDQAASPTVITNLQLVEHASVLIFQLIGLVTLAAALLILVWKLKESPDPRFDWHWGGLGGGLGGWQMNRGLLTMLMLLILLFAFVGFAVHVTTPETPAEQKQEAEKAKGETAKSEAAKEEKPSGSEVKAQPTDTPTPKAGR